MLKAKIFFGLKILKISFKWCLIISSINITYFFSDSSMTKNLLICSGIFIKAYITDSTFVWIFTIRNELESLKIGNEFDLSNMITSI